MSFPTDRKYAETHEWTLVEGRVATMGITQYAADELTDITYVELPSPGTEVHAESACGEIESVKATSEFFSAVDGKVVEVNTELEDHPELVNEDAFGKGWMIKIEISNPSGLESLMDAAAYKKHIASGS
jgi:glycine cleavage system H protein